MAEKKPKKTKNTQEEIEAALARATGAAVPVPPPPRRVIQDLDQKVIDEKLKENNAFDMKPGGEDELDGGIPEDDDRNKEEYLNQQNFVDACYNLTITAKDCFDQSKKFEDKSVVEYIRAINKKIYDETRRGGFSTNVQFRVTQQDWVNVAHITDWYKSRGFHVLNVEQTSEPYGRNAGAIQHNFTISWAEA